jgi:hypothetical protein
MPDEPSDERQPARPGVSRREEGVVPVPVEPVDWWLNRIEGSAELIRLTAQCPHCDPDVEVVSRYSDSNLPRALAVGHRPGCPDFVPDE